MSTQVPGELASDAQLEESIRASLLRKPRSWRQAALLVTALGLVGWMAVRSTVQASRRVDLPNDVTGARAVDLPKDATGASLVKADRSRLSSHAPSSPVDPAARRIERYERMLAAFNRQSSADFDGARADRMTAALKKRLSEPALPDGVRIGSIVCRGSMCSVDVSISRPEHAAALRSLAESAAIDFARSGGDPPLVHLLTRPASDGSPSVGSLFFEWTSHQRK